MSVVSNKSAEKIIDINIKKQQLSLLQGDDVIARYSVSTAKKGVGTHFGSECTPLGWHTIRAKIGKNAQENAVFVGRRLTNEIFSEILQQENPERDWILTRILWLSGLEKGINRGGKVDTMRRYIYIHGCPDSDSFKKPSSHGCIKMRNKDIIELFENIDAGTRVLIHDTVK